MFHKKELRTTHAKNLMNLSKDKKSETRKSDLKCNGGEGGGYGG